MPKHNNVLPNVHLRKHWTRHDLVRTWFNQPARKTRRIAKRSARATQRFPRPVENLRPVVHSQTQKFNRIVRQGRGFSLAEVKAAGLGANFAQSIGISVDHRRRNKC